MTELVYTFKALFAAFRITVWFWLLFMVIAPLFLKHTRNLPPIEKMIYSWVGLGGTIILSIFMLTLLHIYDFISIFVTLLTLPVLFHFWEHRNEGIRSYILNFELNTVISHVRFIENYNGLSLKKFTGRIKSRILEIVSTNTQTLIVIIVALIGSLTRMLPALLNASPFSRDWYLQLERIKNIRLQEYFLEQPDPGGMHSLVSFFSMITQVSPEMILHLLGALTSFFLCIIIYWVTKDLTKNEYPLAPIFAMSIYALVPMLFLPLSLDEQIEANSLDLALCFAVPTVTIFIRNLRSAYKSPWIYVLMGFIATGMTNIFVAFVILLPTMVLGLLALPRRRYFKSFIKVLGYIAGISLLVLSPYILFSMLHNINIFDFLRQQFFDTRAYSYYPLLIRSLSELSMIYLSVAGLIILGHLIHIISTWNKRMLDEIVFVIVFMVVTLVYLYDLTGVFLWIDPDQLNAFYALVISIFAGLCFANLLRLLNWISRYKKRFIFWCERALLVGGIGGLLFLQGGLQFSRVLPATLPNGFFDAYYQIIDEHLPYSYATVSPNIDQVMAKNRHYFMNYDYFLDRYSNIDSVYHQWLSLPVDQRPIQETPPPSIFVFVENPPYGSIQQGILYNAGSVMRDVEQWMENFQKQENRTVNIYYQSDDATVYEIVNRDAESEINEVIMHLNPREQEVLD